MRKKILITGASGFIGSCLAHRFVDDGFDVHVFLRSNSNTWRINDILHKLTVHCVDLVKPFEVSSAVRKIDPSFVFHFAANQACASSVSANEDISTDVVGTWNLLKSLSSCDYELFVNAGSSSEYGFKCRPMKESDIIVPNSFHSFAKSSQTLLCQSYSFVEKKPVITLRLFSVYGPFERKARLIPSVVRGCLSKNPLKLSSPDVVRDFVYVDDVVEMCCKFDVLIKNCGKIFNIGTGKQSSIKSVVDFVFEITGNEVECLWNKDGRSWDSGVWVADCEKSKNLLGWQHKTDLFAGLEKTVSWVRKNTNAF